MPLRIVGMASILLGICVAALGLSEIDTSKELATVMRAGGHAWDLPVSHDVFLVRSKLWAGVVVFSGVLTAIAGFGIAYRKRWGLYVEVLAALCMLAFPVLSRLFFSNQYAFDGPNLVDVTIASTIGLSASLAYLFRPR
jgi:hypothetical protein